MRYPLLLASAFSAAALLLNTTPAAAQIAYANNSSFTSRPPAAPDEATSVFTGRVVSPEGALPGAVVKLLGTKQMVVTNSNGEFKLTIPASNTSLQLTASYAGYADEVATFNPTDPSATVTLATLQPIKVGRKQQLKAYMKTAHRQVKRSLRKI